MSKDVVTKTAISPSWSRPTAFSVLYLCLSRGLFCSSCVLRKVAYPVESPVVRSNYLNKKQCYGSMICFSRRKLTFSSADKKGKYSRDSVSLLSKPEALKLLHSRPLWRLSWILAPHLTSQSNTKNRTTIYLPLCCFSTICRCHTRVPQFKKPGSKPFQMSLLSFLFC